MGMLILLLLHLGNIKLVQHSRQSSGSSDPSWQSTSPLHFNTVDTQRSSPLIVTHRNWLLLQLARHVLLSGERTKKSGQAHVKVSPPAAIRHRWEQPLLLSPHGFLAGKNVFKIIYLGRTYMYSVSLMTQLVALIWGTLKVQIQCDNG